MFSRLYDAASLRAIASLTETEFALYAASGLLPRSIGAYRGLPLFEESTVEKFVRETLKRDPKAIDEDLSLVTQAVTGLSRNVATPASEPAPATVAHDEDVPDVMSQVQAAEYLGVSPAFLNSRTKAGDLTPERKYGALIYTRADLDEFKRKPGYTLRRRRGFSNGKPLKETRPEREAREAATKAAQRQVADGKALLSRRGAADFLGIHEEELRIMERDKLGPAYSGLGYRVEDLQAFKEQHMKPDHRGEDWTAEQTMEYLGVSHNTLRTWGNNGKGPAFRMGTHEHRKKRLYDSNAVKAYKVEHEKDLAKIRRLAETARENHLGEIAAAARKRNAKSQTQRANAPAKSAAKKKSTGAKVKATKSSAGKASPYNRHGTPGRRVANGVRARA